MHDRYHRQTLLSGFGEAGQERLFRAHAAVVGLGAIGCPAADLLCRAGIGRLTLIDRDTVELTNLQRQTLYAEGDIEMPKAEAAAVRLAAVNGSVRLDPVAADVTPASVLGLLEGADLVLDGTDNFQTRYLLNDACVRLGVPLVYAGAIGWRGMAAVFGPASGSPCLRCAFSDAPGVGGDTCDTVGVLGPVAATASAWAAAQALRLLAGLDESGGVLREFDAGSGRVREVAFDRNPDCACCVHGEFDYLNAPGAEPAALCGQKAVQVAGSGRVDLKAIARRLGSVAEVKRSAFMVRAELEAPGIEGGSITVFSDGRAIVRGTDEPSVARSVYAKFIGA